MGIRFGSWNPAEKPDPYKRRGVYLKIGFRMVRKQEVTSELCVILAQFRDTRHETAEEPPSNCGRLHFHGATSAL